jgi:hypothetical protein
MIDVVRRKPAVLASRPVPREDGPAVHRQAPHPRHTDIAGKTDNGGLREGFTFRAKHLVGRVEKFRLGVEHEEERTAGGNNAEGLEGGVQHERPTRTFRTVTVR